MRPEFSALLRDIYPDYQDNLPIVQNNKPLQCLTKSMFFWSHSLQEGNPGSNIQVMEKPQPLATFVIQILCYKLLYTILITFKIC
jgi:hypothetical protein